jgi:hypothetical protein
MRPTRKLASRRHLLLEHIVERDFEREAPMRNSTLKTVAGSLAAVTVIVSLGTSPVLARGGGGGGHGGGGIHFSRGGGVGMFQGGSGFHPVR